ncbi:MAG: hypothetical protein KW793_01825 [Candidatus Doudnabacteria bacterium]|nr:hypothetical protein [Candidatus Doudnabacteria bacterium]
MENAFVLLITAASAFFVHDYLDRHYTGRRKRNIRIIIRGYHFHHSFFGVMIIALGLLFSGGGFMAFACYGYGVGNIWQHKLTHNRVRQRGMVFVTRFHSHNRSIT